MDKTFKLYNLFSSRGSRTGAAAELVKVLGRQDIFGSDLIVCFCLPSSPFTRKIHLLWSGWPLRWRYGDLYPPWRIVIWHHFSEINYTSLYHVHSSSMTHLMNLVAAYCCPKLINRWNRYRQFYHNPTPLPPPQSFTQLRNRGLPLNVARFHSFIIRVVALPGAAHQKRLSLKPRYSGKDNSQVIGRHGKISASRNTHGESL